MSSEHSANYSDVQSGYDISGDNSPILSSSSITDAPESRPNESFSSGAPPFRRSESLFLVLLFASIALLLPAFFFYASNVSPKMDTHDSAQERESPLTVLLPYIPALSTFFHFAFSASYTLFRPFIAFFSLSLALLAPIFIVVNVLFKVVVIMPARTVTGLFQAFYPLYVFCGIACILGGVVGVFGLLLVEGCKLIFLPTGTSVQKGKRRQK